MSIINSDGLNTNWQLNVLRGLQAIADEVAKPLTCAEDGITICSPVNGLNVNVHDALGNDITSTPVGPDRGLDVNIIGGVTLEVNLDAANDEVGIYGYNGTTPTPISVDSNGFLNTNVIFPSSLAVTQDPSSDPWTVDASDLDIRDLLFATDKVDVSGSNINAIITGPLGVQADCADAISTTLCQTQEDILTAIKDAVEGTVDVNIVSGVTLEVNLDPDFDGVTIYGSNPTVPILTDGAGHLQVDILTIPEVEIKNDAGNPIPVNGTVAATQSGTWTAAISSLPAITGTVALDTATLAALETVTVNQGTSPWVVSANDLDIRNLTFATDKVDVSGSSVTITDGTDNLAIDLNGSISSNLYANDLVSGSPELVTTTGGIGYQALDVNVVAPINTITPNILSVTGSGVIAPAVYSITFFNSGPDDEVISFDGGATPVVLSPGVSVTMDAGGIANKYPAGVFAYDVIGTGPIIITYNS